MGPDWKSWRKKKGALETSERSPDPDWGSGEAREGFWRKQCLSVKDRSYSGPSTGKALVGESSPQEVLVVRERGSESYTEQGGHTPAVEDAEVRED